MKSGFVTYVQKGTAVLSLVCTMLGGSSSVHAQQADLREFAGKVVYLDFWASWCAPCRQSFPWMNEIQARYSKRGLVVVAVDMDKEPQLAQKFLAAHPAIFRIAYDPKGNLAGSYDIKAMPTSIVIGRDGRIRAVHQGFHPEEEYEYVSHIEAALRESGAENAKH